MANTYLNNNDRNTIWEAYCIVDEALSESTDDEDISKYEMLKGKLLNIYKKSK